jgi:D-ribose pyranose/furanose isomerase RbsD
MNVYVVTQRYPYSETDVVSVYQTFDAVMNKMEITRLHGMDELEEINIECMEVLTEEVALERLNNVRKYKTQTNDNN